MTTFNPDFTAENIMKAAKSLSLKSDLYAEGVVKVRLFDGREYWFACEKDAYLKFPAAVRGTKYAYDAYEYAYQLEPYSLPTRNGVGYNAKQVLEALISDVWEAIPVM